MGRAVRWNRGGRENKAKLLCLSWSTTPTERQTSDKWDYVYIVLSTVLGYLLVPGTLTLTLKLPYILTLSLNPKLALSLTLTLILSLTQHPNTNPKLDLFLNLGPRH